MMKAVRAKGASLAKAFVLSILAWAAVVSGGASAQEPWPDRVPVLRPDPVTGKEKFWEYWVYDMSFAERFKGFDRTKASSEMAPGVHAIAFRTFKQKSLQALPEHFQCEYEIYFDSGLRIPTRDLAASPLRYPSGVTPGFQRLVATRDEDARSISQAVQEKRRVKSNPLIVADGKLDGRYGAFFFSAYFPDLIKGTSMAILGRGELACEVLAPKRSDSQYWIWLLGELSHNPSASPRPYDYSEDFKRWLWNGWFDPGPAEQALDKGFVRVPEALYRAVLPKVTLIKSVNECIFWRARYEQASPSESLERMKATILPACREVETQGEIYSISFGHLRRGRHDPRF